MVEVVFSVELLDQHVVDVNLHSVAKFIREHSIDQTLVGRACVLQAEEHDFIAICPLVRYEGRFLAVIRMH